MAQFVGIGIDIEGRNIKQFSSLSLTQSIFAHHEFRLVCPAEAIDGTSGNILNTSKDLIGGSFALQINAIGTTGALQFSGVVTQVEAARFSGHTGDIIITGYSPTIILDNGPHCKTWEKKAVKNITGDVLKHFPQNLLQPQIAPTYGETLSYTVQYKETAWQFLSRLSATYGEWFYYNGQKLVLGAPQGNKVNLVYGSNLSAFNMAVQVRPATFQMMAYDYINHEVYNGTPNGIAAKAGLNELGKHALQKSEQFYGTQPKMWHNQFLTNKKQLDDYVNTRAATQVSNTVRFNGTTGHPGVQVGSGISVQGRNVFSGADEAFGDYTILSVNHYCDGQGNYSNDFVAIPASVKVPPVSGYAEPHCETQSAMVTDNHDEKGLGRVRVQFHWMNGSEKSPWLRVTTPHAGGGKGMFIMPEVGEEVIVGFEGNSATKPYIIGAVFHGKAKNGSGNSGNDVKALQTRSGNKVILNDKDGSVFVEDKDGNNLLMDGAGNINIFSKQTVSLTCGDNASVLTMDKDGNIQLRGRNIAVIGSESAGIVSGNGEGDAFSGSGISIDPQNISIGANQKCDIAGASELNAGGGQVTIAASGNTDIQGTRVNIN